MDGRGLEDREVVLVRVTPDGEVVTERRTLGKAHGATLPGTARPEDEAPGRCEAAQSEGARSRVRDERETRR